MMTYRKPSIGDKSEAKTPYSFTMGSSLTLIIIIIRPKMLHIHKKPSNRQHTNIHHSFFVYRYLNVKEFMIVYKTTQVTSQISI